MKKNILIFLALWLASYANGQTYYIKTIAGTGTFGYSGDGGAATSAQLGTLRGLATDDAGNLYMCDSWKNVIRKVDTNGIITTIAGTGIAGFSGNGGPATAASMDNPRNLTVDPAGNIYVTEYGNRIVRKIDASGIISTFAGIGGVPGYGGDGVPATTSELYVPVAITNDRLGNVYFGDWYRLRKVDAAGIITTIASMPHSEGLTIDTAGYFRTLDFSNNRIRKIAPDGTVSFWAGNGGFSSAGNGGPVINAEFGHLYGIASDTSGNIFTTEASGHVVRKIGLNDTIEAFAGHNNLYYLYPGFSGDNGPALDAEMNGPKGIATDRKGNVYFYDEANNRIRKVYFYNYAPSFTAGDTAAFAICSGLGPQSIDTLLAVSDRDMSDTLAWSIVAPPAHGTALVAAGAATNGGTVMPAGLTYTAVVGYSGADTFVVRVFDGAEADTIMVTVTVYPMPAPVTGAMSVCQGSTTFLSCTTTGGTWSSGNTTIAAIDSVAGVVSGLAAGTALISYINGLGCTSVATVTVNPLPAAIAGGLLVCVGQASSLSNPVSGGTWSSANPSVVHVGTFSGVITGMAAGVVNITYTIPGGCYVVAAATANATPAAITGPSSVCVGSTIVLSHPVSGGTWTSSSTSKATVTATGAVTGINAGPVTITYTITPGCITTTMVTVNALPSAITGTPAMCVGGTVGLASAPAGGVWSSGSTSVATVSSGVVTGIGVGAAGITYANAAGCYRAVVATVSAALPMNAGSASICYGSNTTLSNAVAGGVWSSSAPSVASVMAGTGVVYATAAGTANISYVVSAGCQSITQVTVNAAIPAIGGAAAVCVGAASTLTNAQPGGTWSSSNPALGSIGAATGIITGIAAGAITVTYTLPTGCFVIKGITVNARPGVFSGSSTLCQGTTSAFGHFSGTWSSSNSSVVTIGSASGVMAGVSPGTADITLTNSLGCTRSVVATVLAAPAPISGILSVCTGSTTSLSSPGTAGGTWSSSVVAKAVVGSATGIVTGVATGTSGITYTWTNTCKATAVVTVNTIPSAATIGGAGVLPVGGMQVLTSSVPGGTWSSGNPSRATVNVLSGLMSALATGPVAIYYTQVNSCGTNTSLRSFTIVPAKPAPIANEAGSSVVCSVYPNPTSGAITITTDVPGVFTVYTLDGQMVSDNEITAPAAAVSLPAGLAAGIYLCRFTGDDGSSKVVRLELRP